MNKEQLIAEISGVRQRMAELEQLVVKEDYSEQSVVKEDHSEQLLASLFLSSPAAIYIVQDGVFRFVSPQLRQITGYSDYELIGTSPLNLVTHEDRDMIREHTVKLLKGEGLFVHEFRIVTKNANIKWVMETASAILYEGRQAVIANLIDITEHKLAEEALKKSEEKYHDLCENANDMIQCTTPDGRLLYVNHAGRETLGYSEGEVANLSLFEIIHPDYRQHCLELFQRVISGEKINNIETVFINNSGNTITVEGNVNCKFVDDKPVYLRGIFRDITERKRAQKEAEGLLKEVKDINCKLEQSNRELEEFAYIASHDLQEPLRKISSFGALLQESLKGKLDEDQCENLDFMIDGARRMQLMIDDLLTYSRVTTKAKPFQAVDPNKVIENLRNFELATALNETQGTIHVPRPLLAVYGDPSQIHQILQNLIANGLKFHRDGIPPVITINSYPMQNNLVRLDVKDNGIGIDKEYHEQIFIMFKRLHSRTSYKGTGIGLAICKKIVQRHGGEIGVKSKLGEGSTFWFTLQRFGCSEEK
jgi:PAS domain S-box-containing protein